MKQQNTVSRYSAAFLLIASLAACGGGGGGGGGDSASTSSTSAPTTVPAITEPTPAAVGGMPADAGTAGTLPTLAFVNAGTSSTQNVVISGTSPNTVMTFSSPSFTVTGAGGSGGPTWSPQSGMEKANGNVIAYCSAGQTPISTADTAKVPFQQGARIFISANLTAVSDAVVMRGLKFEEFDCAGSTTTMQSNSDGTTTRVDPSGTSTLTAAQVAQFFSSSGFTGPGGGNYKTRAYKYTVGANTRYFTVTKVAQVNPTANYVILGVQTP